MRCTLVFPSCLHWGLHVLGLAILCLTESVFAGSDLAEEGPDVL